MKAFDYHTLGAAMAEFSHNSDLIQHVDRQMAVMKTKGNLSCLDVSVGPNSWTQRDLLLSHRHDGNCV